MASEFSVWFMERMERIGYRGTYVAEADNLDWVSFDGKFGMVYVKQPINLQSIRGFFDYHVNSVLFIVDSDLVTDISVDEPWLRAIHALYYGRIYVWDGIGISAIHHDKLNDRFHRSGHIVISRIVFETVDCWYPGFPGLFKVAMLGDEVFWKTEAKKDKPPPRQKDTSYEDFWKQEFERQKAKGHTYNPHNEDVYEAFREAFNHYQRQYETNNPPPPRRPSYAPSGDKWFMLLMAEKTLEGAKKKYRQLALEHHPDRKGDSPEVIQTMQLINAAWERAKEYLT